jgi:signal transduction histidine kinase
MNIKRNKRWRLCADFKLQGSLCMRVAAYWMICQLSIFGTLLVFVFLHQGSTGPETVWQMLTPALIVSTIVLPLMMLDLLVFSNRFAGPLWNFRRKLENFVETNQFDEVRFRRGDFFQDLSENFNKLCEKTRVEKSSG